MRVPFKTDADILGQLTGIDGKKVRMVKKTETELGVPLY